MMDDFEVVWSGSLERAGLAQGLSSYQTKPSGGSSLFHSGKLVDSLGYGEKTTNRPANRAPEQRRKEIVAYYLADPSHSLNNTASHFRCGHELVAKCVGLLARHKQARGAPASDLSVDERIRGSIDAGFDNKTIARRYKTTQVRVQRVREEMASLLPFEVAS